MHGYVSLQLIIATFCHNANKTFSTTTLYYLHSWLYFYTSRLKIVQSNTNVMYRTALIHMYLFNPNVHSTILYTARNFYIHEGMLFFGALPLLLNIIFGFLVWFGSDCAWVGFYLRGLSRPQIPRELKGARGKFEWRD